MTVPNGNMVSEKYLTFASRGRNQWWLYFATIAASAFRFIAPFLARDTSWRAVLLSFLGIGMPIKGDLWSVKIWMMPFLPLMVALANRCSKSLNLAMVAVPDRNFRNTG
jgi:hypothetical protein